MGSADLAIYTHKHNWSHQPCSTHSQGIAQANMTGSSLSSFPRDWVVDPSLFFFLLTSDFFAYTWGTGTGWPENLWLPSPWKCSRPGWMRLWATWSGGSCPCPWQGGWNEIIFKVPSKPNNSVFLWFLCCPVAWERTNPSFNSSRHHMQPRLKVRVGKAPSLLFSSLSKTPRGQGGSRVTALSAFCSLCE